MDAENIDVDIVIVGGGPTGLLCAVLARQLGLTVSVIDEKPTTLDLGRADGLNARTQQYLEIAGTLEGLRPKGIECNTSSTFANGVFMSRQSDWWTSLEYCHHKCFLMAGQPEVEKALMNQLEDYWQTQPFPIVRRNDVAMNIEEDGEGVTVRSYSETDMDNYSLDAVITRAKFAIGADGAHSLVRHALKIGFEGTEPGMTWIVMDTLLSTNFPVCKEIISLQLHGESRVLWVPRERNLARFYVRLLEGQEMNQANAQDTIREHMAPYQAEFVHTEWFSTFEVRERLASRFVSKEGMGRIALAGDAAHVHSINGAQGLNTGVADAFALVWRLASACKGSSFTKTLMSSYELERRTIAQGAVGLAAKLVRDTCRGADQYVATIAKNAGYVTGMGITYSGIGSPIVVESQRGIWKAGQRCPDLTLTGAQGQTRLYSMVTYGRFMLLLVSGDHFRDLLEEEEEEPISPTPPRHETWFLLPPGDSLDNPTAFGNINDASETGLHFFESDVVSPDDDFAVVVRPDMYIGCVGEHQTCLAYLDGIANCGGHLMGFGNQDTTF